MTASNVATVDRFAEDVGSRPYEDDLTSAQSNNVGLSERIALHREFCTHEHGNASYFSGGKIS